MIDYKKLWDKLKADIEEILDDAITGKKEGNYDNATLFVVHSLMLEMEYQEMKNYNGMGQ